MVQLVYRRVTSGVRSASYKQTRQHNKWCKSCWFKYHPAVGGGEVEKQDWKWREWNVKRQRKKTWQRQGSREGRSSSKTTSSILVLAPGVISGQKWQLNIAWKRGKKVRKQQLSFFLKRSRDVGITKNKEAHSCLLVFLFYLFILCTSSTPPCEWTRCLSVCRQMEGLFPQFNEGRLLEAYPWLPWSLICSRGVHWHCLVSVEGTDPKAWWRVSWQTACQWMQTTGGNWEVQDVHAETGRIKKDKIGQGARLRSEVCG